MKRNRCVLMAFAMLVLGAAGGYRVATERQMIEPSPAMVHAPVPTAVAVAALESGRFEAARDELKPLADAGNPIAQRLLGEMHRKGLGVPRNNGLAFEWYRRAAEQGDAEAQYELGGMYAYGAGVDQDNAMAAEWSRRAAENGYGRDAQSGQGAAHQGS